MNDDNYDDWCNRIWNGERFISGGSAREFRLKQAGGVRNLLKRVAEEAAGNALAAVNRTAAKSVGRKVVPLQRRKSG
jgi:hypothetical protein